MDNTVKDCIVGIYLSTDPTTGLSSSERDYVYCENNAVSCTPGATPSGSGILVDALQSVTGLTNNKLQIEHNTVSDVFNGIQTYNFYDRSAYVNDNQITLQPDYAGSSQNGVYVGNCQAPQVINNTVNGNPAFLNANARAYSLNWNNIPTIGCNDATDIGQGYLFTGAQAGAFWHTNHMQNNQKGYVLDGTIGNQGNASLGNGNQWLGTWAGNWQTYVNSGLATSSTLFVPTGSPAQDPMLNGATLPSIPYQHPTSLQNSTSSMFSVICPAPPPPPLQYRMTLEQVAQDSVQYSSSYQARDAWMAQLAMYQNLMGDSSLTDSSVILQDFVTTATNSRFDWIVQLGNAIGNGQDSLADTLLAHPPIAAGIISGPNGVKVLDGTGGDSVFAHYKLFYELYHSYRDSTFNAGDSASLCWLASLCPRIDGAVVFQARSLRVKLSNEVLIYPDDCPDAGGGEGHFTERRIKTEDAQQYTLIPNPNDGNVRLLQKMSDAEPVQVTVYNSVGAVVQTSTLVFEANAAALNLSNIPAGVYYMTLLDNGGHSYILHFVKK